MTTVYLICPMYYISLNNINLIATVPGYALLVSKQMTNFSLNKNHISNICFADHKLTTID